MEARCRDWSVSIHGSFHQAKVRAVRVAAVTLGAFKRDVIPFTFESADWIL